MSAHLYPVARRPSPLARALGAGALALAAASLLVAAPLATAALYKWVDANGRVVYSDQPPAGGVKAEIVGSPAAAANPDALKEFAAREAEFKKRQADKAEDVRKADKAKAEAQRLATLCTQARAQVAGLRRNDGTPVVRLNDKGERVTLDDATRKVEADRLEALIKERNCPAA
jgi:hypothetical protein